MRRGVACAVLLIGAACASAIGCSSSPASDGGESPAWRPVLTGLDGALLSVWGTSPKDVWAVGGPRGNDGLSSLVVHFDGSSWTRLHPGGSETYWWVHGASADDVWMVGENGRATRYRSGSFTEHPTPTTATLYGVWAASADDVWAVGGTPEGGTGAPNDLVFHWDGHAWSPVPLPQTLGRAFFKVWGTGSEDLYVVGEAGTIWHRVGDAWRLESDPPIASGTLLTVFGCSADEVYAVGGRDVLRSDGQAWGRVDVLLTNDVNGVACGAPGAVAIVGFGGMKQRLVDGAWIDDFGSEPFADLHSVWADGTGAYWAAGGDFLSAPAPGQRRNGVVARYGGGKVPGNISGGLR